MRHTPAKQGGMTLIIGLIMLALMTVMALSTFNIGRVSMDIIGNMQQRSEVLSAANGAIQEAISTSRLVNAPNTVFLNPCSGNNNTRCVDTNGDGEFDITVTLTPAPFCVQAQPIPNASLDFAVVGSSECTVQVDQSSFGIAGGETGNSLCANSLWEVRAVAVDAITQASVTVTEGVAVLASTANVSASCP